MRQRLGIAHALIGEPQVLVLDEPANGLDPAGIRWMRGLLRGYAERGGAVLLSSHLIHEVEQIADEIVVVGRGRVVAAGSKAELLARRRHVRPGRRTTPASPRRCAPTGLDLVLGRRARRRRRRGVGRRGGPGRRAPPRRAPAGGHQRTRGPVPGAHGRHAARRETSLPRSRRRRTSSHEHPTMLTARRLADRPLGHRSVPLGRLVEVELRKLVDTRSGRWLLSSRRS